ncbi:MAG: hypothetical protein KGS61_15080, partial [Verrucomicrobia bacterium]|nr:hypothetical protein [Verrucomicrobiota bacterium]
MATNTENIRRRVVPRWRPFREALASGELSASTVAKAPAIEGKEFLEEKQTAWESNHTLPFAVDFVSA